MAGVLLLSGLLLGSAAVQAHLRAPAAARTRDTLVKEVEAGQKADDRLQRELDALRLRTANTRDRLLAATSEGEALSGQLAQLERTVGTAAVTGPGLRVRLDDAPADTSGANTTDTTDTSGASGAGASRILDRDVQDAINALWAAGAEALAVNGERVTAETAIRSAGDAILVDLKPLSPPYDITAVGDPVAMETSFASSAVAGRFRTYTQLYGIRFSYHRVSRLILPAASAVDLRYAAAAKGVAK